MLVEVKIGMLVKVKMGMLVEVKNRMVIEVLARMKLVVDVMMVVLWLCGYLVLLAAGRQGGAASIFHPGGSSQDRTVPRRAHTHRQVHCTAFISMGVCYTFVLRRTTVL